MQSTKNKILVEIEELREEIHKHNKYYFVDNDSQISDFEYDLLVNRLKELENLHPEFITPDSPTQRIGETPLKEFKTVFHTIPMKSLGNTYNENDLNEFDKKVKKNINKNVKYTI